MSYRVEYYREEFLEMQEQIGNTVFEKWVGQRQTTADDLKKAYSGENFDPETKLYAFKDDKMVGFLTASILPHQEDQPKTARMEFPLVLEDYEDAVPLLLETAFDTLRRKHVSLVLSRAAPLWGKTVELANQWGYELNNVMSKVSTFDPREIEMNEDTSVVKQFDVESEIEAMLEFFVKIYDMTDDSQIQNIKNQILNLDNLVGELYAQSIIKDSERITTRQIMYKQQNDDRVILGQPLALGDNVQELKLKVLAHNIAIAKEHNIERLEFAIFGQDLDEEAEKYQKVGLSFKDNLVMYKKTL